MRFECPELVKCNYTLNLNQVKNNSCIGNFSEGGAIS